MTNNHKLVNSYVNKDKNKIKNNNTKKNSQKNLNFKKNEMIEKICMIDWNCNSINNKIDEFKDFCSNNKPHVITKRFVHYKMIHILPVYRIFCIH